jgi:hypothetical protein
MKEMEKITIEIIKDKDLPKKYMDVMNKGRVGEWGEKNRKNFKKDYWPGAKFFFVKEGKEIVAFGALRDVTINYLGKKYKILGICNIISVVKGKGYGKMLIQAMIKYLKAKGKTGLGFTDQTRFYEKAGLKSKKSFTWRFASKNPKTGEIKFDSGDCDGIYIEGKDNLIKKVLSTKGTGYYWLPDVKDPHW